MRKLLPGKKSSEKGQVVLIVLLIMSVILVVGLSIASRSVTDIKISQQSQEAARALWVAQAGLEEAIKLNQSIGAGEKQPLGGVEYSVTKRGIGGSDEFVFPESVAADEAVTLWLINHNDDGTIGSGGYTGNTLKFFWGKEDPPPLSDTTPALEAILIFEDSGKKTKHYVYDPNSSRRSSSTHFDSPSASACSAFGDGTKFAFCSDEVTIPDGTPYLVRLKLLFNTNVSHPVGVKGNADFPQQGSCYESSATIAESGVTRKLRQCQLWGTSPSIFDNVLFSGTNLPSD